MPSPQWPDFRMEPVPSYYLKCPAGMVWGATPMLVWDFYWRVDKDKEMCFQVSSVVGCDQIFFPSHHPSVCQQLCPIFPNQLWCQDGLWPQWEYIGISCFSWRCCLRHSLVLWARFPHGVPWAHLQQELFSTYRTVNVKQMWEGASSIFQCLHL